MLNVIIVGGCGMFEFGSEEVGVICCSCSIYLLLFVGRDFSYFNCQKNKNDYLYYALREMIPLRDYISILSSGVLLYNAYQFKKKVTECINV